jgi:hypothetical protein
VGRAPAFWSEANVKLINDNFVPVALSNAEQTRNDAVGQFCRASGLKLDRAEALIYCLTAGGTVLEESIVGVDLANTLAKFKALPASERSPDAVKVPNLGLTDAQRIAATPPAGGLILKVHSRVLMHDGKDRLRYVNGGDLLYGADGKKTLEVSQENGRSAAHQAQPDHMWLTEAEWKALVPANPQEGDKVAFPAALTDRFLRWHLNPLRFYGRYGSDALDRKDIRAGALTLTVHAVTGQTVSLRLDGFAKIGQAPPAAVVEGRLASLDAWGFDPRVLGFLEYDRQKQAFIRLDIVALGEHFGRLGLGTAAPSRIGLQPLGMSFTLVKGEQPRDRIPPGRAANAQSYFNVGK